MRVWDSEKRKWREPPWNENSAMSWGNLRGNRWEDRNLNLRGRNMETPYCALQRWHDIGKKAKRAKHHRGTFMLMAGQTVVQIDAIPTELKKKMVKAVEVGYARAKSGLWPDVLGLLSLKAGVPIGYLGKSNGVIWLRQDAYVQDKIETLRATVALTGDMAAKTIHISRWVPPIHGYVPIDLDISYSDRNTRTGTRHQPQLHSFYETIKFKINDYMKEEREQRQPLIDLINSDRTITIPFST